MAIQQWTYNFAIETGVEFKTGNKGGHHDAVLQMSLILYEEACVALTNVSPFARQASGQCRARGAGKTPFVWLIPRARH
jgi:hypothetical protein